MIGLTIPNLDLKNGTAKVFGKGSKERTVFFSEQTAYAQDTYLRGRPDCDCLNVFVNEDGTPMKKARIEFIYEKLGERAGFRIFPHLFRHTGATLSLAFGENLENLRIQMGHSDLKVTQVYTHVGSADLASASKRSSPIANLLGHKLASTRKIPKYYVEGMLKPFCMAWEEPVAIPPDHPMLKSY